MLVDFCVNPQKSTSDNQHATFFHERRNRNFNKLVSFQYKGKKRHAACVLGATFYHVAITFVVKESELLSSMCASLLITD